jgi:hypothetical protein
MWKQLGLTIEDLEKRPSNEVVLATSLRQLLRAHDEGDRIAIWLASGAFFARTCLFLRDLMREQPSWDSKDRWFEGLGLSSRISYRDSDRTVHMVDAMVWGLRPDVGNRQWAEPFMLEMVLTPDMRDLASYTVRFGDRREHPGEDFQLSLSRIERELEAGVIDWAFVFRRVGADVNSAL